jgi:DnaJ like chaperone protein
MSIWGKIVGGVAGLALGGPLGALIGVAAGHVVDRASARPEQPRVEDYRRYPGSRHAGTRQIAFTIAVIALGAKMAKADGRVTRTEIDAFKQVFRIPPEEARNVGRVFNHAKRDTAGYQAYARQVAGLFPDAPEVLEELLNALFHIARADGEIHPAELEFLRGVAHEFGFTASDFDRIRAANIGPDQADPYAILGVSRDDDDATIKQRYRALVRELHPDHLIAKGMPEEFIDTANDRLAKVNGAWESISAERGL